MLQVSTLTASQLDQVCTFVVNYLGDQLDMVTEGQVQLYAIDDKIQVIIIGDCADVLPAVTPVIDELIELLAAELRMEFTQDELPLCGYMQQLSPISPPPSLPSPLPSPPPHKFPTSPSPAALPPSLLPPPPPHHLPLDAPWNYPQRLPPLPFSPSPSPPPTPPSLLPFSPPLPIPQLSGCTLSTALNYNLMAVVDDSSCEIGGCTDSHLSGYNPLATYDAGTCPPVFRGCTNPAAANYRSLASVDDSSCQFSGCLQSQALNYDPKATLPARCILRVRGCTNTAAINFYKAANKDDGTCLLSGCTDSSRTNYESRANIDSGRCTPLYPGCTSPSALNFQPIFNTDDRSCRIAGCTDSVSPHFDPQANIEDRCSCSSSCASLRRRRLDSHSGCLDPMATTYDSAAVDHDGSYCVYPVGGCADSNALNYLVEATVHDTDMCEFALPGCTVEDAINFDSLATVLSLCVFPMRGCTDSAASNFVSVANMDDASCSYDVTGCADEAALNYDSTATISAGCRPHIIGCLDSTARNFAVDATTNVAGDPTDINAGRCNYVSLGCRSLRATNYDSGATLDDGSCVILSPPPPPPPPPSLSPSRTPLPSTPSLPLVPLPSPSAPSPPTPSPRHPPPSLPVPLNPTAGSLPACKPPLLPTHSPVYPPVEASPPPLPAPLSPPSTSAAAFLVLTGSGIGSGATIGGGVAAVLFLAGLLLCCRRPSTQEPRCLAAESGRIRCKLDVFRQSPHPSTVPREGSIVLLHGRDPFWTCSEARLVGRKPTDVGPTEGHGKPNVRSPFPTQRCVSEESSRWCSEYGSAAMGTVFSAPIENPPPRPPSTDLWPRTNLWPHKKPPAPESSARQGGSTRPGEEPAFAPDYMMNQPDRPTRPESSKHMSCFPGPELFNLGSTSSSAPSYHLQSPARTTSIQESPEDHHTSAKPYNQNWQRPLTHSTFV